MSEEWRKIDGHSNYAVSNLGRIKRITPGKATRVGRIVKPWLNPSGYLVVSLCDGGPRVGSPTFLVHIFVAEAFLGPRPTGLDINHKDGNKLNPGVSNLEYVTRSENILHAFRNGLKVAASGQRNGNVKLTAEQAAEIRSADPKLSNAELGRRYGVDRAIISRIRRGVIWREVGGPIWPQRRSGPRTRQTSVPLGQIAGGTK